MIPLRVKNGSLSLKRDESLVGGQKGREKMESAHQKKVRESRQLIERPSQPVTKRAEEHYKELSKGHASENRKETGFDS